MYKTIKIQIIIIFFICSFALGFSKNLAAGKRLEYNPEPKYSLTNNQNDPFELTDGIIDKSLWYEIYRGKTVGWYPVSLVEITLNLQKVEKISHINIYTTGGGQNGVEYFDWAAAAISSNGKDYYIQSFVDSSNLIFSTKDAIPYVIKLPVNQKARYIKLFVRPTDDSFFSDEIEVIESSENLINNDNPRYQSKEEMVDLLERAMQLQRDSKVLFDRIAQSSAKLGEIESKLQMIKNNIAQLNTNLTDESIAKTESEFAKFKANYLKSEYKADWICSPVDAIDIVRYGDLPSVNLDCNEINLYQWQNEYDTAAVNITNCSNSKIIFKANLSPLQIDNTAIASKEIFEIRRLLYVRVLNAGLVGDPLVLQNDKPFTIKTGETVQLWLQAYAKDLAKGEYKAALAIEAVGNNVDKKLQTIPIKLTVANKTFPNDVPFYSCNWDDIAISDRFTGGNPFLVKYAVDDLKKHYINVLSARPELLYSDSKTILISHKLLENIKLRDTNSFVLLGLGGHYFLNKKFGSFKSTNWESDFINFLRHLRDYMINSGFDYNDYAIYPFDEYIGEDFIYIAKIIKKVDPKLKIYANKWFESKEQFRQVKDLIDIWCPHIPDAMANTEKFEYYKKTGDFDKIWCYHAYIACDRFFSQSKLRVSKEWRGDNRIFWRTMPMTAVYLGMDGAGFWVYQDANMKGWDKDSLGNHGVIYNGSYNPDKDCYGEAIVPSKRWQMWREGIEDAVILKDYPELLKEFVAKKPQDINSKYLQELRKRAIENSNKQ